MRIPRDINGSELVNALIKLGYLKDKQVGSHIKLTTVKNGEHHVTVPNHSPIKIGTLNNILKDISEHFGISREELVISWAVLIPANSHVQWNYVPIQPFAKAHANVW